MRKSPVMMGPGTFVLLLGALLNCPFFTGGDYYTRDVSHAPVDAHSAQYVDSMVDAGNTGGFWAAADPVEFINVANAETTRRKVRGKVAYHRFDAPYPWADTFRIEPLSDAHAIVVDTRTCEVFETTKPRMQTERFQPTAARTGTCGVHSCRFPAVRRQRWHPGSRCSRA